MVYLTGTQVVLRKWGFMIASENSVASTTGALTENYSRAYGRFELLLHQRPVNGKIRVELCGSFSCEPCYDTLAYILTT